MTRSLSLLASVALGLCSRLLAPAQSHHLCAQCAHQLPIWIEADSAKAIHSRLLSDFSLTFEEGADKIIAAHPGLTREDVRQFAEKKYVEVKNIDGEDRMHRKSVRNVELLNPDYNGGWKYRGWNASPRRISYVDSVIRHSKGQLPDGGAHRVRYSYTISVPTVPALIGDTLRVWMIYPLESARQSDVKLISSSHPATISTPEVSDHRTIYFTAPVADSITTFTYEAEFTTRGQYFHPDSIRAHIKPYDTESALYKKYTAFDNPHIIQAQELAKSIVGDETDPFRCSELVYDYIIRRYPWAGAREYSTIECIPQYVIDEHHGDCGQVSLLYISLMRSLGIPARWESGWMLHPGELNLHDWAEVYFEGVGWVPVDTSFGRYTSSPDPEIQQFYSHGMDSHRLASNLTVSGKFYPEKRFVRSETVDAQLGEVECTKGNLFYPGWNHHFDLISVTPITVIP